jgi:hypothetical protein
MSKYCGKIGYATATETSPGIWTEVITERRYYGDVTRLSRRLENGDRLNSNVNISHSISIVADGYAYDNILALRYAEWMGTKWKVTDVEVQRPRMILTLGGVYNGDET